MSIETGQLHVIGPHELTELSVMDGGMHLVASGTHELDVRLAPGVYRLRARLPGDEVEVLVLVRPGSAVRVDNLSLSLDSTTPLSSVRSTHEYHEGPAADFSRATHYEYAPAAESADAAIFLFARTTGDGRAEAPGFELRTQAGAVVCSFPAYGDSQPRQGWLALSVTLPPGTYILEYDKPRIGRRAQAIFAERGWQTQVFAPWGEVPRFDQAVMYMLRIGEGFVPSAGAYYTHVEAALQGLSRAQSIMTPLDLLSIREGTFENPMLGLLGVYMLLGRRDIESDQLRRATERLTELLPHSPDVYVLSLLAQEAGDVSESQLAQTGPFNEPPLLAAATERALRLATSSASLCPDNSWLASVALRRTSGSAWTCWDPTPEESELLAPVRADLRRIAEDAPNLSHRDIARRIGLPLSIVQSALALASATA